MQEINEAIEEHPEVDAYYMTGEEITVAINELKELEERQIELMKKVGVLVEIDCCCD